ncbi:HNH endonuclease [Mycolicibacterium mageritense]|uniref:HNH endonuclease n=1 Tax=Mycolicibacterium mageritense TaxID=53462 RepID=UPI002573785E|nr:HNH endonuclease signature motif containing protein [Mycolicibacterium mageritense]
MAWKDYKQPYRLPERVRQAVLKRDNNLCQIRDEGCTVVGNVVDHIISMKAAAELGWAHRKIHGMSNLRASCRSCNQRKASMEGRLSQGNDVKVKRPKLPNPGLAR